MIGMDNITSDVKVLKESVSPTLTKDKSDIQNFNENSKISIYEED